MARYTGPKTRIARKLWSNIRDDKAFERRSYPPGQHGMVSKKNLNMLSNGEAKAKYFMDFRKQFRGLFKSISY
jgi:small subunit ribosomal protein S4